MFWSENFLGQKIVWVKKLFGSKKFLGQKNFFGQKIFGVKQICSQKKNWVKNFWSNDLGPIFFVQKIPGRVNTRGRIYDPPPRK